MWKHHVLLVALIALAAVAGLVLADASQFPEDSFLSRVRLHRPGANKNAAVTNTANVNTAGAGTNLNVNTADQSSPSEPYQNAGLEFGLGLPPGWTVDAKRSGLEEVVLTDGAVEAREAVKMTRTDQTIAAWAVTFQGESGYRVTDYELEGYAGKRVRFDGIGADYLGVKVDGRLYVITVGRMADNGMLASLYFIK